MFNGGRRNGIFKLSDLTNFLEQHELRDISGLGSSCEDEIEAALKIEIANDSNAEIFSAKIEEVYLENKYFLFVNYCHNKGIEYMSDLEGFNFSDLSGVRGIGKGKIEDIISRYEQYDSGNFGNNIESDKREKKIEKTIFNFINEQLEDIDIDFLTGLGIKLKVVSMLISNGYKKLGDIEGISTKTLLHIVGDRNFVKFEGIEDELKKPLFEIFDDVLFAQSKEEDFCIDIKRACGYTLQELGKPDILMNNKVETVNNLFFLCQKLFSEEFDFRRPHISRQGLLEEMSVKKVALHLLGYPIKLSFSRYQEIADKLKWSPVTTGLVFSEIETDYARINDDMYIKRDAFDISEDAVNEIRQVLRRKMSKGYLSLINFDDWEDFPDVPYEWNVFLLRTIVNIRMSDLRIVEIKTKDRRYERGIVIEANSDIIDYTDLIISFLKNMGMKEVSENNMLTLLVMNNLTYKMIPKELYVSDKLKYINEKFLLPE